MARERIAAWLRRHAPFLAAAGLGVLVRVAVSVGYWPALLSPDSKGYLGSAVDFGAPSVRPLGYSVFLRVLQTFGDSLALITITQHLLGLALAVAVYALLLRRGMPPWGATLAALPLLLDPLQLVVEQFVFSDVLFTVLLFAACVALLWNHRPGAPTAAAVGALVAGAGLVRSAGLPVLLVFLVALLCLRLPWRVVAAFLVTAAVPIGAYLLAFHSNGLSSAGPQFLYGRVVEDVPCAGLGLPAAEEPLCPQEPPAARPPATFYIWRTWPQLMSRLHPGPGETKQQLVADFDKRVVRGEPLAYGRAVLRDFAAGFAPDRTHKAFHEMGPGRWLFHDAPWGADPAKVPGGGPRHSIVDGDVARAAARTLTRYQLWVYTPGPLMALLLLASIAAVVGIGRARFSGNRVAVGLLAGSVLVALLMCAAVSGFTWRYQLPQISFIPAAGALAVHSLVRRGRPSGVTPLPPVRPLDRAATWTERHLTPAAWRPAVHRGVERGWCQASIAVLVGLLSSCLVGGVAAASGWFTATSSVVVGVLFAGLVVATLLVARRRSLDL